MTEKINTRMLTLAREARGLSQMELAEKIKTSQANINRWESGFVDINTDAFKAIVKSLDFPESFFYQSREILPPYFYRKRDKVAKSMLDSVDASINIARLNILKLLGAIQHKAPEIPQFDLKGENVPVQAAQALRKKWKMAKGTIENLTEVLESQGILIMHMGFETERVDGRSLLTDHNHPIIFTNQSLLGDRLRFTLAFELGHLILHAFKPFSFGEDAGHEANLFAAEFLMPEKDIAADFKEALTLQKLAELKTKWKVSMQALLYRASDLGYLTDNQKRYLIGQFNALQIRRREPKQLDIPQETPLLLRDLITKYRARQKMSMKEMAGFFCLSEKEFIKMYSK